MKRLSALKLVPGLAAGTVALGLALPAMAATAPSMCAGVSDDGQNPAAAANYSLKLVYAQPDGAYLGDVATRISSGGNVVVDAHCEGPWLLADLPSGTYEVTATYRGATQTQTVSVGADGQVEQVIRFQ